MLTAREIADRLSGRGLVFRSPEGENAESEDFSRRNRNYRIADGTGGAVFVKQNVDGRARIAREASVYRLAHTDPAVPLASYLPRFHESDGRLLILGFVRDSRTVSEHGFRFARIGRAIALELGRAVASIHETGLPRRAPAAEVPWILSISAPSSEILRETSGAQWDVLRIVHESGRLCRTLEALEDGWSASALVHGDLRLENVLLEPRRRQRLRPVIKIVDWEMSGSGDPAWDVGCAIASLLWLWINSLPFVPGMTPDRMVRTARIPLARIAPAIATFWSSYAEFRRLTEAERSTLQMAAIRFAAARLIQHSWETMADSPQIVGNVVCALQLALNLMSAPRRAANQLMERA